MKLVRLPALGLLFAYILCPVVTKALDLPGSFGGESRIFLEGQLPESQDTDQEPGLTGGRAESTGRFSIDSPYASYSAEIFVSIRRDGGIPELRLDECMATVYPSEHLVFRFGRFRFDDSQAIILPSADFMSPQVAEALLSGSPRTSLPEDLVQANFLLGTLAIRGTLGLTAPPSVVPELDSPWFPLSMLPENLTINKYGLVTSFTRRDITTGEASTNTIDWKPAFLFSLQHEDDSFSLGLRFFHGLERTEVWQGFLLFPNGYMTSSIFDLQLVPYRNLVTAFGGSMVYTRNNWRWFAEGSHTQGRSADSRELDSSNPEPNEWNFRIHSIDELTGSTGLLWSSFNVPLRIAGEVKWSSYQAAKDSTVLPVLGKAAALAITWTPLPSLNLDMMYLRSLRDDSSALTTRLRLAFGNDHEAMLMIPWLWGEPDTELGRYDNGFHGTAALIVRY